MDIQSKEAQIADDILKSIHTHGSMRLTYAKFQCEQMGLNFNRINDRLLIYSDYDENTKTYRLNTKGREYVTHSQEDNNKRDNRANNIGCLFSTFMPIKSIFAQGDNPHVDMSNSRRSSFWDFLQDVIKRFLGKL